jgi:hypothetical protein
MPCASDSYDVDSGLRPEAPCPFCGSLHLDCLSDVDGDPGDENLVSMVLCKSCEAVGPIVAGGRNQARQAWNMRTLEPKRWLDSERRGTSFEIAPNPELMGMANPCPFCGNNRLHFSSDKDFITCCICEGGNGLSGQGKANAIRKWNTRMVEPEEWLA